MTLKAAAMAFLALAACGGSQSPAENTAEALEEAAEQSDPAAAAVLENEADAVREQGAGGASAQQALDKAGDAQAATVPRPQKAPPSVQAEPNRGGQQTPPPKQPADDHSAHEGGNSH
jgi:membrane-bound lytic murein transglycosylase B